MKPNESKRCQSCWTGRALQSHLHSQHRGGRQCLLQPSSNPSSTEVPGTLSRVFWWGLGFFWGLGVKGTEKEGMRFKPWVTVQALCSLTCHSETGLSQRFCWPELPEWSMKEFWSIWAISVHSNFKTHALGTE